MNDVTQIVGDFFEQRVSELFELIRTDSNASGTVPDLISKEGSFYVEVKASAYNNGGVINRGQLCRFNQEINIRRFYAFAYHSITKNMKIDYPTGKDLRNALDLRNLFLFPLSIVKAHFEESRKRKNPKHDDFVQLKESRAQGIFELNKDVWQHLGLKQKDYKMINLHGKIHLVTREGYLEKQILNSFHPELF